MVPNDGEPRFAIAGRQSFFEKLRVSRRGTLSSRDDKVTLLERSSGVDMRTVYVVGTHQQIHTVVGAVAVCAFAEEDRHIPFGETGWLACGTSWTLSLRNDKGSVSEWPRTCGQISHGATLSVRYRQTHSVGPRVRRVRVSGNLSLRNDEFPEHAVGAPGRIQAAGPEAPASG